MGTSAAVQFSLGLGLPPNPMRNSDDSYWVRPMSGGHHRIGWTARLALLPEYSGSNSIGLLASENDLDATDLEKRSLLDARRVDETVYGVYGDGDWGQWGLHATIYRIDFSLRESANPRTETIVAGYAQLERRFAVPRCFGDVG